MKEFKLFGCERYPSLYFTYPWQPSYKRDAQVILIHSYLHSFSSHTSCLLTINFPRILFSFKMVILVNFKNALLTNFNPNSESGAPVPDLVRPTTMCDFQNDPPNPSFFAGAIVLDSLLQVWRDIIELTKSCLLGKMLSTPWTCVLVWSKRL